MFFRKNMFVPLDQLHAFLYYPKVYARRIFEVSELETNKGDWSLSSNNYFCSLCNKDGVVFVDRRRDIYKLAAHVQVTVEERVLFDGHVDCFRKKKILVNDNWINDPALPIDVKIDLFEKISYLAASNFQSMMFELVGREFVIKEIEIIR